MSPPAVILAGGRSSRMGGGHKCLLPLDGKPILSRIIKTLTPQTKDMLLNANGDTAAFTSFGLRIEPDPIGGAQGPLAGLLAGMLWSRRSYPEEAYLLSVPSDTPMLPPDLVARLSASLAQQKADIAIASCSNGLHPTIGLWPVDLAHRLECDLMETNLRSVQGWAKQFRVALAHFDAGALTNINTPADMMALTA
jgi:molybdopterin-guanine dinucleotide biosynthesis protein A